MTTINFNILIRQEVPRDYILTGLRAALFAATSISYGKIGKIWPPIKMKLLNRLSQNLSQLI